MKNSWPFRCCFVGGHEANSFRLRITWWTFSPSPKRVTFASQNCQVGDLFYRLWDPMGWNSSKKLQGNCISPEKWYNFFEKHSFSDGLNFQPPSRLPSLKLTAKAPENRPHPKRKLTFQPSIFRCENVSFREGIFGRILLGTFFPKHRRSNPIAPEKW